MTACSAPPAAARHPAPEWGREFDPPPGEVFSVDLDAYVQPSSQLGRRGEVALMDGERVRVRVAYRTWLVP